MGKDWDRERVYRSFLAVFRVVQGRRRAAAATSGRHARSRMICAGGYCLRVGGSTCNRLCRFPARLLAQTAFALLGQVGFQQVEQRP